MRRLEGTAQIAVVLLERNYMDRTKRTTIRTLSGAAIAATAAGLFLSQVVIPTAMADDAKVQCSGINACKGKSECATAKNACKGQNECKGQGWLKTTDKDCRNRGGVVERS
jgi:hypothetical protein